MRFLITLPTNQNYARVENKEVPLVLLVLAWLSDQITKFREPPIFLTAESFNQSNVAFSQEFRSGQKETLTSFVTQIHKLRYTSITETFLAVTRNLGRIAGI